MLTTHFFRIFTRVQLSLCSRYSSGRLQLLLHELSNFANHPLLVPLAIRELWGNVFFICCAIARFGPRERLVDIAIGKKNANMNKQHHLKAFWTNVLSHFCSPCCVDGLFFIYIKIFHYKPLEVSYKYTVKTIDMLHASVINAYPTIQKYGNTK